MTTFANFNSSFRSLTTLAVTDVNTIISDFRSETVTNGSPAWTESPSQTFISPTDGAGRFFKVVLARTAATRLEWKILDQAGTTVCDREIDISASGTTVNYYTGQYHAWVESMLSPEIAMGGILDPSPLANGAYSVYVYGNGFRNTGASADGAGSTTGQFFMIDNGGSSQLNRIRAMGVSISNEVNALQDPAGNLLYYPPELSTNIAGTFRWNGRPYQVFLVDSSFQSGTVKTIVIGSAGETGTFRALSALATTEGMRFAVRTA